MSSTSFKNYTLQEQELIKIFRLNQGNQFLSDFVNLFEDCFWGPKTFICEYIDNVIVKVYNDDPITGIHTQEIFKAMKMYAAGYANGQVNNE